MSLELRSSLDVASAFNTATVSYVLSAAAAAAAAADAWVAYTTTEAADARPRLFSMIMPHVITGFDAP